MTVAAVLPRPEESDLVGEEVRREFRVDSRTRVVGLCNFQKQATNAPALILTHGLTGEASATYMQGTAKKAFAAGFHTVRMNVRNCGGSEHLAKGPCLYHSGLSQDLRSVAEELVQTDGFKRLYLAGFSMGANITLKMSGEYETNPPDWLCGVVAVSPPIDLGVAAQALHSGMWNRMYERFFLKKLRHRIRTKLELVSEEVDLDGIENVNSMMEFDDRFTGPLCGFGNGINYYRQASSMRFLPFTSVPTILIHAQDDGFIPFKTFDNPRIHSNPYVSLIGPKHGGHCGFISLKPAIGEEGEDADRFWAENRIVQFCKWLDLRHQ